jgi:hypothetical protein
MPLTADRTGAATRSEVVDDAIAILATWPDAAAELDRVRVEAVEDGPPLTVDGPRATIRVRAEGATGPIVLAIREGLERRRLSAVCCGRGGPGDWTVAILAHVTAVADTAIVHRFVVEHSTVTSPEVVRGVQELVDALPNPSPERRHALVGAIARTLGERDGTSPRFGRVDLARAEDGVVLALPTSVLLASGGKDGQAVDWRSGVNRYGVSTLPQPWMTRLASCTASSPSEEAYAAADRARTELLGRALEGTLPSALDHRWQEVRDDLAGAVGIGDGSDATVLPTPSGTDAETVATAIALAAGPSVTTIVVGPLEVGSGTVQASLGQSFSTLAPNGRRTRPGELIDGMPADVELLTVEVRDLAGQPRGVGSVEDELAARLVQVTSAGRRALLHTIDGSKTGVRAPGDAAVRCWQERFRGQLDVVVDAAQLRVDDGAVAQHLAAGRMVIVTGSKFFSGPPFCGALLVPAALRERLDGSSVPAGLADYLDRWAVPPSLTALRAVTPSHPNVGLLLRWTAALEEMRPFLRIAPAQRDAIVSELSRLVEDVLRTTPEVDLVPSDCADQGSGLPPATIFTLRLRRQGRQLDADELKVVQDAMRQDLAAVAPADCSLLDRAALSRQVEIGQPVPLGPNGQAGAAVRLAFGAPSIRRIALDPRRGAEVSDRLLREVTETIEAVRKLSLVLQRWDELPAVASLTPG